MHNRYPVRMPCSADLSQLPAVCIPLTKLPDMLSRYSIVETYRQEGAGYRLYSTGIVGIKYTRSIQKPLN